MGKIDEVKEFIGLLKVIFVTLVATDVSLIGWLASSYKSAESVMLWLGLGAVAVLSLSIPVILRKIVMQIKRLEEL